MRRIAIKLGVVDRGNTAIGQAGSRCSAVDLGLVDIDAFLVLSRISRRILSRGAGRSLVSIPGCGRRSVQAPVIGDVVIHAGQRRAAAGNDRLKAGKRVRRASRW